MSTEQIYQADWVREEVRQHGDGEHLGTTVRISATTALTVALPRPYTSLRGDVWEVPFVLHLGALAVHMERAELARVHDLLQRALAAPAVAPATQRAGEAS